MSFPCVHVLLATYNGAEYISELLDSLVVQQGVSLCVYVMDDGSSDRTRGIIDSYADRLNIRMLPKPVALNKGASASFLALLQNVSPSADDYFAFCDQDDRWVPDKLLRAISCLCSTPFAEGYSSSVEAFWPDGRKAVIAQCGNIKAFDFLFEGAGQGCTFVFRYPLWRKVVQCLGVIGSDVRSVHYHDWLVYAVCRASGGSWFFDDYPCIEYRQHSSNDTGAKSSFSGARRRLSLIFSGWYGRQIAAVGHVLSVSGIVGSDWQGNAWRTKPRIGRFLWLMRNGRRKMSDRVVLAVSGFFGFV
jgi:rhamnosyltransferase